MKSQLRHIAAVALVLGVGLLHVTPLQAEQRAQVTHGVPLGTLYGAGNAKTSIPYSADGQVAEDTVLESALLEAMSSYPGRMPTSRAIVKMDRYLHRYSGVNGSIAQEENPALRKLYAAIAVAMYSRLPDTAAALAVQILFNPAYRNSPYAPGMMEMGDLVGESETKSASRGAGFIRREVLPRVDRIQDVALRTYANLVASGYSHNDPVAMVGGESAMRMRMTHAGVTPQDAEAVRAVLAGVRRAAAMDATSHGAQGQEKRQNGGASTR